MLKSNQQPWNEHERNLIFCATHTATNTPINCYVLSKNKARTLKIELSIDRLTITAREKDDKEKEGGDRR